MYGLCGCWQRPNPQFGSKCVFLTLKLAYKSLLTTIASIIPHRHDRLTTPIEPSESTEAKRKPGRPPRWTPFAKVDEEGTPDVYRILIDKLQQEKSIEEYVKEPLSMDWRAERALMPAMLQQLAVQPSWMPRVGEIVLFVRMIGAAQEVLFDSSSHQYRIYDSKEAAFIGFPRWEAGVVGQVTNEELRAKNLVCESGRKVNITYSGFRVEAFPDPNSNEKPDSKQYKYVPLHHTRPFIFWQDYLKSVPEKLWHPTIKNALTVMSTVSLVEKFHFRGSWPKAELSCKGMYLGSEFIVVGDLVRLTPKDITGLVEDVMRITSIKLVLSNLDKASGNDYDEGHPYNSAIHVVGTAYTTNPDRALRDAMDIDGLSSSIVSGYKRLYCMHGAEQSLRVPFKRVLSRCYEAEAIMLWFPPVDRTQHNVANIDTGAEGIRDARTYSAETCLRIQEGRSWFWADTRVEALDLGSLNAQEVGRYDEDREPYRWRAYIKVMDGVSEVQESELERDMGYRSKEISRAGRPLLDYSTKNSLVRSALQAAADSEPDSGAQSNGEENNVTLTATVITDNARTTKRDYAQSIGNPRGSLIDSGSNNAVIDVDNDDYDEGIGQSAVERSLNGLAENMGKLQAGYDGRDSLLQNPKKQRVEVVID